MTNKISQSLFLQIRALLKQCVGYSIAECYVVVQRHHGDKVSLTVFEQIHRTLLRLGYLRVMGRNLSYSNDTEPTYCWNDTPVTCALNTDLLIVCEINHHLKTASQSEQLSVQFCEALV